MKIKGKIAALSVAMALAVSLAACGSGSSTSSESAASGSGSSSAASESSVAESSASAEATRTVTDMAGREVTIPEEVTKVATNAPNEVTTIGVLKAMDKLVAAYDTDYSVDAIYNTGADKIPYHPFGEDLNTEELLNSGAQVCFFRTTDPENENVAAIEDLGIPVVCVDFTDVDDRIASITLMGDVLGGDSVAAAEKYVSYVQECADQAYGYEVPAEEDRPTVLAFFTYMDGQYIIPSNDHFVIQTLSKVGAVSASDYTENSIVNIEDILNLNPDILINLDGAAGDAYVKEDEAFTGMDAYVNGNYYVNPCGISGLMTTGTVECAMEPLYLASILNENATDIDFAQTMKDFYQEFFDYTLTDEQVETLLSGSTLSAQ